MTKANEIPADIKKLSFEDALASLEDIVQQLEGGAVDLEASMDIYARGVFLKRHCEEKLALAQEKVAKIVVSASGEVSAEPVIQE